MRVSTLGKLALAAVSVAALAACGGGGGGGGDTVIPLPPTPPALSGIATLGVNFGTAFRASNNAEPVDPSSMVDFTAPDLTRDPFEPTGA